MLLCDQAPNSVSTTIFSKLISVCAFQRASLCFLVIRITLRVCQTAQSTRTACSAPSDNANDFLDLRATEIMKNRLQFRTTNKSKKFHQRQLPMFDLKYLRKPVSFRRQIKSPVINKFSKSSSAMQNAESATLKPSIIVTSIRSSTPTSRLMQKQLQFLLK